jgi:serine/threonine protein kinase
LKKTGDFKREGDVTYANGNKNYRIVQNYYQGDILGKSLLKAKGDPKKQEKIIAAGRQALNEVHGKGIQHGDAHLRNIIYQPNGKAKMVDFGQSSNLSSDPAEREKQMASDHSMFDERVQDLMH